MNLQSPLKIMGFDLFLGDYFMGILKNDVNFATLLKK
jgi:hypothetical protein